MPNYFWLSDRQFARLQPLLPTKVRGVPRVDDRRVISGIIHVLQSGCRWRDAPPSYGPYKTLYNRFVRWARKGVWDQVFAELAAGRWPAYSPTAGFDTGPGASLSGGRKRGALQQAIGRSPGGPHDQSPRGCRCGWPAPPAARPPGPSGRCARRNGPGRRADAQTLPGRYRLRQ